MFIEILPTNKSYEYLYDVMFNKVNKQKKKVNMDFFEKLDDLRNNPEYEDFADVVDNMVSELDKLDETDTFGAFGWKYTVGIRE